MSWFRNLGIRAKLLSCFAVVVGLAVSVGALALREMNAINNADSVLYDGATVPINDIGELHFNYMRTQMLLRDLVLETDESARAATREQIAGHLKETAELLTGLGSKLADPKVAPAVEALVRGDHQFAPTRDKALALDRDGKRDELQTLLLDVAPKEFEPIQQGLDGLQDAALAYAKQISDANDAIASSATRQVSIALTAMTVVAGLLAWFAARSVAVPVGRTLEVVEAFGRGDLSTRVGLETRDEVGRMAQALDAALSSVAESVRAIAVKSETLAAASEEMSAVSTQMGANAEETSAQATVVSAAAEEISSNIQTVAAGCEEMNASIREIARSASHASEITGQAVRSAEKANETMEQLSRSSTEIGAILGAITSISEQTNLLALNATIEAARAGDAGKGFAVVANEVKELAKQAAHATEDIGRKVDAIQASTKGAIADLSEITGVIRQISDTTSSIAGAVEEQSATTNEIGRNVGEAAKGSGEIAGNIAGVASAAKSTTDGAQQSRTASGDLAQMASELKSIVSRFRVDAWQDHAPVARSASGNGSVRLPSPEAIPAPSLHDTAWGNA